MLENNPWHSSSRLDPVGGLPFDSLICGYICVPPLTTSFAIFVRLFVRYLIDVFQFV